MNLKAGLIDFVEYIKIQDRIETMQKLEFAEDWHLHDPDTYEWLKYKVAADIGGTPEREAFALYERLQINKRGEVNYRLF